MQRLPQLQHHIVGHIHYRVDTAHAGTAQALLHPQGRRTAQVYAPNDPANVAWASRRRFNSNLETIRNAGRHWLNLRRRDRQTVEHAQLPGQTGNAQAVASVWREIHVDYAVIQPQIVYNVFPKRSVGGQGHQSVRLFRQTKFLLRTKHAVGFDPTQLGLFDLQSTWQLSAQACKGHTHAGSHIRRTTDHLVRLLTVKYFTDTQFLCIRMGIHCAHFTNDHTAAVAAHRINAINFQASHRDLGNQLLGIQSRIHPFAQPLFTNFHALPSLELWRWLYAFRHRRAWPAPEISRTPDGCRPT